MRAQKSEPGTPDTIFRAPVVAPSLEPGSISIDEFAAEAIDPVGLAAKILRARRAYEQKVAEAAYFLAQRRGFEPGRELEDWVAAEVRLATASAHRELERKSPSEA